MLRSVAFLTVGFAAHSWAQFSGLSTPSDGSRVYFASTLRLKGSNQPAHGKLFVADESGVRLVRSREHIPLPQTPLCRLGEPYAVTGAEVSGDGRVVVAAEVRESVGGCSYPQNTLGSEVLFEDRSVDLPGLVRVSPNGRFAIQFTSLTTRGTDPVQATLLDLQTGVQTPVDLPPRQFPVFITLPRDGRAISDNGVAILNYSSAVFLLRPGESPQQLPLENARLLAISADAVRVLYISDALHMRNLSTGEDRVLDSAPGVANISMSDDGRRVAYRRDGQLILVDTDAPEPRVLLSGAELVRAAVLSGDGRVVYAATSHGRLLKIDADTANAIEIIPRTPFLDGTSVFVLPGFTATVPGAGLADDLILSAGGRKAFITVVTPTSVSFLVPWNAAVTESGVAIAAESPTGNSPFFESPETTIRVSGGVGVGAIAHQNWDGFVTASSWPRVGEIIHVWAVGLGPVSPEVPDGMQAPSAEPLARLTSPMTCSNSEILYAGLAPGYVERVYQVDLRIGNTPGYQQFFCSIGGGPRFIFLTFLVLP